LEPSFFVSKSIFESLYLSTSMMGRTRYTNPWVPEGHTHIRERGEGRRTRGIGEESSSKGTPSIHVCLSLLLQGPLYIRGRRRAYPPQSNRAALEGRTRRLRLGQPCPAPSWASFQPTSNPRH
jgi:hypothetical protein